MTQAMIQETILGNDISSEIGFENHFFETNFRNRTFKTGSLRPLFGSTTSRIAF